MMRESALECKSEKQYSSKDLKSANILMNSHYQLENKAIICTCKSIYLIGDGCYLLPVTSI